MRAFTLLFLVGGSLVSSCAVTSRTFVRRTIGYHITGGKILQIEGLDGIVQDRLIDGTATRVRSDSCQVALRVGKKTKFLHVPAGSLIVLGDKRDYVLRPPDRTVEPPPPPMPEPGEQGPSEETILVDESNRILDLIERSAIAEARKAIDRLGAKFPESQAVQLLQKLLQHRLPQIKPRNRKQLVTPDPAAAGQALQEALSLLEEEKQPEALTVLERAYELDPNNKEIASRFVELLKRVGLELYSQGAVEVAKTYWQRVLEIQPDDPETLRFLDRAESVKQKI